MDWEGLIKEIKCVKEIKKGSLFFSLSPQITTGMFNDFPSSGTGTILPNYPSNIVICISFWSNELFLPFSYNVFNIKALT